MGMNDTPSGERTHITFFGCVNAGKSSVVNAFTSQQLSIVSDVRGTTTDPVKKSMELLPLGPVMITDTPGLDDESALGGERIARALRALDASDIALLVADITAPVNTADRKLIDEFKKRNIPWLLILNKSDLCNDDGFPSAWSEWKDNAICISALKGTNITELKERVAGILKDTANEQKLISDLISAGDLIVLVTPIDKAAPKGRLILPQQQVIRDALDSGAIPVVCRESELEKALTSLSEKPRMVITDSQVFAFVNKAVPEEIPLTSFSILMARYKGNLKPSVKGAAVLKEIKDHDKILIAEGCTHHRQCGDIGSVKLPAWIKEYSGAEPEFFFTSGTEFPADLSIYRLIIHCGGCMLNHSEAVSRYRHAAEQNIPITNYGIAIAAMKGILHRSLSVFQYDYE